MLDAANAGETWRRAVEKIPGMAGDYARKFNRLEISGMNRMTVFFSPENAFCKTACQRPEQVQRFEQALTEVTGQTMRVEFKFLEAPPPAAARRRRPGRWSRRNNGSSRPPAIRWCSGPASCSAPTCDG